MRLFILDELSSRVPLSAINLISSRREHFDLHSMWVQASRLFHIHKVKFYFCSLADWRVSLNGEIKPKIVACWVWIASCIEIVFLILMTSFNQYCLIKISAFKLRVKYQNVLEARFQSFCLSVKDLFIHSFKSNRCVVLIVRERCDYILKRFWIIVDCVLNEIWELECVAHVLFIGKHSMNIVRISWTTSWIDFNAICWIRLTKPRIVKI